MHITSIFSPEDIYGGMVSVEMQKKDTVNQLLRRITEYVYHYVEAGEYKEYRIKGKEYTNYRELKVRARGEWEPVDKEDNPFD